MAEARGTCPPECPVCGGQRVEVDPVDAVRRRIDALGALSKPVEYAVTATVRTRSRLVASHARRILAGTVDGLDDWPDVTDVQVERTTDSPAAPAPTGRATGSLIGYVVTYEQYDGTTGLDTTRLWSTREGAERAGADQLAGPRGVASVYAEPPARPDGAR